MKHLGLIFMYIWLTPVKRNNIFEPDLTNHPYSLIKLYLSTSKITSLVETNNFET